MSSHEHHVPPEQPASPDRRNFLKNLLTWVLVGSGTAAGGYAVSRFFKASSAPPLETLPQPVSEHTPEHDILQPVENSVLKLNSPEQVVAHIQLDYAPDTAMSFLASNDPNIYEVYFSAGRDGYRAVWEYSPLTRQFTPLSEPSLLIRPDTTRTREYGQEGYHAFSSVIHLSATERISLLHREFHPSTTQQFPFHAEITLAYSNTSGESWTDAVPILQRAYNPADGELGVGQPSMVVLDGYAYCYYTQWKAGEHAIHVARAPVADLANPSSWQKWDGSTFAQAGPEGPSQAIILPSSTHVYAALPCVSIDQTRNRLLMTLEVNEGFAVTTSKNGIDWEPLQLFALNTSRLTERASLPVGTAWYSYPSHTTSSDGCTHLFFSKGKLQQGPHRMHTQQAMLL